MQSLEIQNLLFIYLVTFSKKTQTNVGLCWFFCRFCFSFLCFLTREDSVKREYATPKDYGVHLKTIFIQKEIPLVHV